MGPPDSDVAAGDWTLHHIGVATLDAMSEAPKWEAIGYHVSSDLIHDPIQNVRVVFLRGTSPDGPLIELVEPVGEDAPVRRFLDGGSRFYHVAFEVPNLEEALARVRSERWLIVQRPVPAVAFDHRHIAWCYTPSGDLIELVEASKSSGDEEE